MTERTHYVYRAFDETGELLYVGCTKNPHKRWLGHRGEGSRWVPYAHRFKVSGPYPRQRALDLEREAINSELPWFNWRDDYKPLRRMHVAAVSAIRAELEEEGRLVGLPPHPGQDDIAAFLEQSDAILRRAAMVQPDPSIEWRHEQYRQRRRNLRVVRSA